MLRLSSSDVSRLERLCSGDTYAGFDEALSPVLCQEKSSSGGARSDDIGLKRFLLRLKRLKKSKTSVIMCEV